MVGAFNEAKSAQWIACSAHLTATLHVVARMLDEGQVAKKPPVGHKIVSLAPLKIRSLLVGYQAFSAAC
jgi:hypothetical protein